MKIGGLLKQTLIDYPGNISAMVFSQGCNFRCPYCHNADLVLPERFAANVISKADVFAYLKKNKLLLDALVISGGEPTLHPDLPEFIAEVRALGLKVKLDTNGTNPGMLRLLLDQNQLDFVAMDIKTALDFEAYQKITGGTLSLQQFDNMLHAIKLIQESGIEHEFRTTVWEEQVSVETVAAIKYALGEKSNYTTNAFVSSQNMLVLQ